jgi:D-alanyl-D-alanine carboxypeptidase
MSTRMAKDEFLRDKAAGDLGEVELLPGDRIIIEETSNGWSKVQAFERADTPVGWVPTDSLTRTEAISKAAFASQCWDLELRFGVNSHYLAAVAELRSKTMADEKDGLVCPFQLSQSEWDAGRADPDLNNVFQPTDILDWRMQAVVFASMTRRTEDALAGLLGSRVSAAQLLLAQMVGAQCAATLIQKPTAKVDEALKEVKDSDLPLGIARDQLLQRFGSLFNPSGTGAEVVQQIADALKPALDTFAPFITDAGQAILRDAVAALPPEKTLGAAPVNGTVLTGEGNFQNTYPSGVEVSGGDLVVHNTKATWFGGPNDPSDNGNTASGITTRDKPELLGCALPLPVRRSKVTQGTPFPTLPFQTQVRVKNLKNQQEITVPIIDIGPAAATGNGIDLTEAAFNGLGAATAEGRINVDFIVIGGARFVPDVAVSAGGTASDASTVAFGDVGDVIHIPDVSTINVGLSPASLDTMLTKFGTPGALTRDCSPPAQSLKSLMDTSADVGPFRVTGLHIAVQSLSDIFDEVRLNFPDVYKAIKTAGMLCVRCTRGNSERFSNHSWGAAIDLYFGSEPVPQGEPTCHRGISQISEIFNKHGWYWGAGFRGKSVDSMHFELAEETIRNSPDLLRPAP